MSCIAEQAETPQITLSGEDVIEAGTVLSTKTYQEDCLVKWTEGDCITAFMGLRSPGQYKLAEGAGTTYGKFVKVNAPLTGPAINGNYAVYPADQDVAFEKGQLILDLPGTQTYAEGGFAPGFNPMVAVSDSKVFYFQNLCGYFVIPLYGNVKINSLTIEGGQDEALASRAYVEWEKGEPVIQTIHRPITQLKLECKEPVVLNDNVDEPTEFWFVVPPTAFKMGLTVTIEYNDGQTLVQGTPAKSFAVQRNEIYRMAPLEVHQKELKIERVWGKYPTEWPGFSKNLDRCATMDEDYIYVAKQGSGEKGVWAIPLDGDLSKAKDVCMDGIESAGTHYTSCVRTILNPATGKHILLLCNLALTGGDHLYLYAYENGIDAAPTKLLYDYTLPTWAERRFGDFFTVVGDWDNGYVWFRTNTSGASTTARWTIKNGKLTNQTPDGFNYGYGASQGKGSFYQYDMSAKSAILVTPTIGLFYDLNAASGILWDHTDQSVMCRMFGITPFEYEGTKYIAYTKMKNDNAARSWVKIIEDMGSAEQFLASLEADKVVYQAAVQIEEEGASVNVMPGATFSDQTSANCAVIVKEDGVYIMAHHHNVGLSLFKMVFE